MLLFNNYKKKWPRHTSCRHQQPSCKCIARQPEHWQGMLNILPESFADFKLKLSIKNETCFSVFFRCGEQETFCIHTDKTVPYDTHSKTPTKYDVERDTVMHTYLSFRVRGMVEAEKKIEHWLINFVWHQLSVHCCERIIPLSAFIKSLSHLIEHDRALNHKDDYRVDSAYFIIMSLPQADKRSLISTSHLFPFLFGTTAVYRLISDMAAEGEWPFHRDVLNNQ